MNEGNNNVTPILVSIVYGIFMCTSMAAAVLLLFFACRQLSESTADSNETQGDNETEDGDYTSTIASDGAPEYIEEGIE